MKNESKKRTVYSGWGNWKDIQAEKLDKFIFEIQKDKNITTAYVPQLKIPEEIKNFFNDNHDLNIAIKILQEKTKHLRPKKTVIQRLTIEDKWVFEMRLKRIK